MDPFEYQTIENYLKLNEYPENSKKNDKRALRKKASNYTIKSGNIVKQAGDKYLLVIQRDKVPDILREVHDHSGGHQHFRYSYRIAKERYYWPGMYVDIQTHVSDCIRCQKNKPCLKAPTMPLQPLPVITKVWYRVGMDLTGPLVESQGYKYILTFIDHFTKWIETRPLRTKEAKEVASGIFSIYCRQGAPVQIITDNGPEFTNTISKSLQEIHNCKLIFSSPYHPQTNGLVESAHKAIKRALVKTINEKSENWFHYLEQVTFAINIRPRDTTNYSAFELMHGSRKPRLPNEAENLSFLYPDVSFGETMSDETENDQIHDLIETMKNEQEISHQQAGLNLAKSKEVMKKQYDKKVNPITQNIKVNDEVFLENMCKKKSKGGKLQDKWIGPYPITKVSSHNLQVCKNNKPYRVKRSKAKLCKRPLVDTTSDTSPTKISKIETANLITQEKSPSSDEDNILTTSSPFIGAEELTFESLDRSAKRTKAEILDKLFAMKDVVIKSIQTHTPLSQLHGELDKRCDMNFKELLDWRLQHYPSVYELDSDIGNYNIGEEITDILRAWYLESFNIKIPEFLVTDEDFEISSHWNKKSVDYSTKVLLPVIQLLLINPPKSEIIENSKHPEIETSSSESLEDICVTWGGEWNGISLVNTCPLDNFITALSLNMQTLLTSIKLASVSISPDLQVVIEMVKARNFNELRCWIAPKLSISLVDAQYDFLGYEGKVIQLLGKVCLGSNLYKIEFQCWSCCYISEKNLDLSSVYNFKDSCESTVNSQISSGFKCLKCRDPQANIEPLSQGFLTIPPILILEIGHLHMNHSIHQHQIEDNLSIIHNGKRLVYSLIGFTIHAGLHFFMKTKYDCCWYIYDGLENPKLNKTTKNSALMLGSINTILYALIDVEITK